MEVKSRFAFKKALIVPTSSQYPLRCLLSLSPFARGVAAGTVRFEGDVADAVFDLYQTGGHREMGQRWTFDGPDRYRSTLWETGLPPLGEWEYVRVPRVTSTRGSQRRSASCTYTLAIS